MVRLHRHGSRAWLVASTVIAVVASACARQAVPPEPPPPPMPTISEAPPGTLSCAEARSTSPVALASAHVRAVFAGCYSPPCAPCPKDVTCSPCQAGWCELASEDESCKLRVQLSQPCRPDRGVAYVFRFSRDVSFGYEPHIEWCAELQAVPRAAQDAGPATSAR